MLLNFFCRPSSARTDRSDRSSKEQQQKKIATLEKELEEVKHNLDRQIAINESHKIAVAEDFEKWKKQKHWQQTADKLKAKLEEKTLELEKLNQTCSGYRILIERLEREKHNLETKVKNLKSSNIIIDGNRMEMVQLENEKLKAEIEALASKFQIQQYHAGGLGAAMLQEKLEAQERKIAVLELTSRVSLFQNVVFQTFVLYRVM